MAEIQKTVNVNRKYKDRLFRLRFGSEEYKADILSLYNALNGNPIAIRMISRLPRSMM